MYFFFKVHTFVIYMIFLISPQNRDERRSDYRQMEPSSSSGARSSSVLPDLLSQVNVYIYIILVKNVKLELTNVVFFICDSSAS